MAVFRAQVFYRDNRTGKWSNVYHVRADLIGSARASLSAIGVPVFRAFLHPACTLVSILTSAVGDDTFISDSVELTGLSPDSGSLLPLFNSAKILFSTSATGRPDYKFLKGYLTETLTEDGQIELSARNGITSGFQDFIGDMQSEDTPLVSESDDLWGIASTRGPVQMRQEHRRRRRTVTP